MAVVTKTKEHVNFYENLKEAHLRLLNTVVLYDGEPYYVLAITDHKGDGIFRMYLDYLGNPEGPLHTRDGQIPYDWYDEPGMSKGQKMDDWLSKNEGRGVIRKMMNSPLFNRFRPFPLGMVNYGGYVVYSERTPTRYTQQGLTGQMVIHTKLSLNADEPQLGRRLSPSVPLTCYEMYKTITNQYPTAKECLEALLDPSIANTSAAFHRNFAFVKGPVGLMFFAYKQDVIGYVPNGDFSRITLAPEFRHTKEVVEELNLFEDIRH